MRSVCPRTPRPQLESYERLVFLDADLIAVNPVDSLFRAPKREMVVTDGPWSRFNAGLMVRGASRLRCCGAVALPSPVASLFSADGLRTVLLPHLGVLPE